MNNNEYSVIILLALLSNYFVYKYFISKHAMQSV